ncbi:MAG: hypothetical protein CMB99_05990 [Flavobacteriaceae bacterium]|nr:hypothetical protein [Flavobacteriaceae bacterium]|tara:strand:- start:30155 stop:30553 length:399 start_codon:yes stop_codon:yes gene_type:complete
MKAYLSTAIVIFAFLFANMDNQEIIWLDANLRETSQSQAKYYKVGNKREGQVTYYYKNRNIFRKTTYVKGKIEGRFYEYYDTGELREVGVYENGLREGNWKVYYKSGKIKQKGKYSGGEKVGVWKTYYKNEN